MVLICIRLIAKEIRTEIEKASSSIGLRIWFNYKYIWTLSCCIFQFVALLICPFGRKMVYIYIYIYRYIYFLKLTCYYIYIFYDAWLISLIIKLWRNKIACDSSILSVIKHKIDRTSLWNNSDWFFLKNVEQVICFFVDILFDIT